MSSPIKLLTQYSILYLPEADYGKSVTDYGHLPITVTVYRMLVLTGRNNYPQTSEM